MNEVELEFVKLFLEKNNIKQKTVLEVGSWLDKGQEDLNLRPIVAANNKYIGSDMRSGQNVDVVCNGHNLTFADHSMDVVLCLNTLEHDDDPFRTMHEIDRVLKPDGIVILSVPFNFPIHAYPNDYFRYTPEGVKILGKYWTNKQVFCVGNKYVPEDCIAAFSNKPLIDIEKQFIEQGNKYVFLKPMILIRRIWWEINRKLYRYC